MARLSAIGTGISRTIFEQKTAALVGYEDVAAVESNTPTNSAFSIASEGKWGVGKWGSGGVGEWDSGEMGRGFEWENISSSFNI